MRRLIIFTLFSTTALLSDAIYNDNYMSRSGIVHRSIETGISNRVDGRRLLYWRGYITHLPPIIFDGIKIDKYSKNRVKALRELIRVNRDRIKYISIIGYSSSIIDEENRIDLEPWVSFWHRISGEHRIEESKAVRLVNSRIRTIYNILREEGVHASRIYNENRLDREPLSTEATREGQRLNNRVVLTIYSYRPLRRVDR